MIYYFVLNCPSLGGSYLTAGVWCWYLCWAWFVLVPLYNGRKSRVTAKVQTSGGGEGWVSSEATITCWLQRKPLSGKCFGCFHCPLRSGAFIFLFFYFSKENEEMPDFCGIPKIGTKSHCQGWVGTAKPFRAGSRHWRVWLLISVLPGYQ